MTRTRKTAGSMRKQPTSRRARQAQARKKAPGHSGPALGKVAKRGAEPKSVGNERHKQSAGAAHKLSRLGTPAKSAHAVEPAPSFRERSMPVEQPRRASITDRPVARSIKPEANTPETRRSGVGSAVWGLAALLVGGAVWIGLDRSPSSSEAGESVQRQQETQSAATLPAEQPAEPEASPESEPIDLDAELTTPPKERPAAVRISSAKRMAPARQAVAAEPPVAPTPVGPFSAEAAEAQLSLAVKEASACRQPGDPTGVARVAVTFAPSGRVTSATISDPPFAGTSTGSCIAKTMRGMSLPAFEGEHVTISKTVVIM